MHVCLYGEKIWISNDPGTITALLKKREKEFFLIYRENVHGKALEVEKFQSIPELWTRIAKQLFMKNFLGLKLTLTVPSIFTSQQTIFLQGLSLSFVNQKINISDKFRKLRQTVKCDQKYHWNLFLNNSKKELIGY